MRANSNDTTNMVSVVVCVILFNAVCAGIVTKCYLMNLSIVASESPVAKSLTVATMIIIFLLMIIADIVIGAFVMLAFKLAGDHRAASAALIAHETTAREATRCGRSPTIIRPTRKVVRSTREDDDGNTHPVH